MKSAVCVTGSAECSPPLASEIELSLFGPGVGECVVAHLGGGDWLVVDSCSRTPGGRPIALEYLERLGVSTGRCVRSVVASHWHDDHVGGLADLVREATAAKFSCSSALGCREFLTLVAERGRGDLRLGMGVDEFASILDVLEERGPGGPLRKATGPQWANDGTVVFRRSDVPGLPDAWVIALSPSSASMTLALREFATLLAREGDVRRRAPTRSPNQYSVVLWMQVGSLRVLLGGDLERSADSRRGWQAVVRSAREQDGRARAYKAPHHGSENADDPTVWSEILEKDPIVLLTPNARGGTMLPSPREERLRGRSTRVYSTGDPGRWKPPCRTPAVEKTVREVARSRRVLRGPMGHVQVRWNLDERASEPRVRLAGGAVALGGRSSS